MPELPEVETIRRQLEKEVVGCEILDLWTDSPKQVRPNPQRFQQELQGGEITKVGRRAKLLIFEVKKDTVKRYFVVHLKLTGRLLLRGPGEPPDNFVHVVLKVSRSRRGGKWKVGGEIKEVRDLNALTSRNSKNFIPRNQNISLHKSKTSHLSPLTSNLELRFADARKFGFIHLILNQKELDDLLTEFGPEPLDDLTPQKFTQILKKTPRKIKKILMDQKAISGIGNIYANDALWLAQIHPERKAFSLTPAESQSLFQAIKKVLREGLKTGGASDQWYRQIHGEEGEYQEHFKVYGRAGELCLRHPQQEILYKKIGQRGTFWCPLCQRL